MEDGGFFVFVDGDDGLRVLHARQVLDRTRDADGDVEVGRDDLTGLADLIVVGHIACVNRRSGGANRRAELVGNLFQHGEVFTVLHATAPRDDDLSRG